MKKIKFMLEYECYPLWIYNDDNELIDFGVPDELIGETEVESLLDEIQSKYESLFTNNEKEFEYKGFQNADEKTLFFQHIEKVILIIRNKLVGRYIIENLIDVDLL